jgi:TRAP-type C4-dicarboxylate transport system substrate-binding protein
LTRVEARTVVRVANTQASSSISGQLLSEFGRRVNARSKNLDVQIFGYSVLGGTQTIVEGVQLGTIQMSVAGYGVLGALVGEFGAMELPYTFGTRLDMERILQITQSALFEEWQKMLSDKAGIRIVAPAWYYGHRDLIVTRAATTPAGLRGLKIRAVPARLYVETVRALGAVPTPVDWPETYSALAQGVIDGVDAATDAMMFMKFFESAKYMHLTHHITGLNAMIANKRWHDALASEDKKIVEEELVWFQIEVAKKLAAAETAIVEELKAKGVTIVPIDLSAFQRSVREARVAEQVAEAQKWRPDTLRRFRETVARAGFRS